MAMQPLSRGSVPQRIRFEFWLKASIRDTSKISKSLVEMAPVGSVWFQMVITAVSWEVSAGVEGAFSFFPFPLAGFLREPFPEEGGCWFERCLSSSEELESETGPPSELEAVAPSEVDESVWSEELFLFVPGVLPRLERTEEVRFDEGVIGILKSLREGVVEVEFVVVGSDGNGREGGGATYERWDGRLTFVPLVLVASSSFLRSVRIWFLQKSGDSLRREEIFAR